MNSTRLFARARTEPPIITKPATATEIVAGIRWPAAFEAAQAALDALHARRAETHAALLVAIANQPDLDRQSTGAASTRQIEKLGR